MSLSRVVGVMPHTPLKQSARPSGWRSQMLLPVPYALRGGLEACWAGCIDGWIPVSKDAILGIPGGELFIPAIELSTFPGDGTSFPGNSRCRILLVMTVRIRAIMNPLNKNIINPCQYKTFFFPYNVLNRPVAHEPRAGIANPDPHNAEHRRHTVARYQPP